jgi:hypothetical protein
MSGVRTPSAAPYNAMIHSGSWRFSFGVIRTSTFAPQPLRAVLSRRNRGVDVIDTIGAIRYFVTYAYIGILFLRPSTIQVKVRSDEREVVL